jgi:cytochrome c556
MGRSAQRKGLSMKRRGLVLAWVIGTAVATAALAAPADVITARQQNYKAIGKAMKGIMDELKTGSPSISTVQTNARTIAGLAPKLPGWFPAGTGPESGVKTAALPAVWQNNADFQVAAKNFAAAAQGLNAAAAKGDAAQIGDAAKALGGTCKSCHDRFRLKE